jgi:hypothetical protein
MIAVDVHVDKWITALKKWTPDDDTVVSIINFTVKNGTILILKNTGVEVDGHVS